VCNTGGLGSAVMTTSKSETFVPAESEGAVAPAASDMNALRETLEDYTLRFAPRSYRKWSTGVVAASALGGIAYLADFSIGANIGISYGTGNALLGIAVFAVVIVLSGFPLAYYAGDGGGQDGSGGGGDSGRGGGFTRTSVSASRTGQGSRR